MATRIIGIDFGTSTTVVRVHNAGAGNRVVPLAINAQRTIPTIAFRPKDSDEIYYGYDAQAKIDSEEDGALYENFKMDLISEDEEKRNQAEVLIEGFLRYVYVHYQNLLNGGAFDPAEEVKVYVSHPAKWNSYARNLMKQSVERVGFCNQANIALKDEPTAAMLAVIHEKNGELKQTGMLLENQKYKTMMIDMGAGTTDIVLCTYRVANGKLEIDDIFTYPSASAPGLCGGREIDDAIMSEAERFVNRMQQKPSASGKKALYKFRHRVKKWKALTVSPTLRQGKVQPEPDEIAGFRDTLSEFGVPVMNEAERFSISREYFEAFTRNHWMQWAELIKGAFNEAKGSRYNSLNCPKRPEDVDLLIITGGHSQWYIVPEYLSGKKSFANLPAINFTKIQERPNCLVQSADPQETVAVGLCHLDEDVVGTIAASNDIAISFTCERKYLGTCELIKKGTPLPFEKRDFKIKNTIKGNFISRRELIIEYSIVTDQTNTIVKSLTIPSTSIIETILRTVLSTIGVSLLDIPLFLIYILTGNWDKLDDTIVINDIINHNYTVELSPDIFVNEEGIIKIGGTITVDDEKLNIPEIII